jgi:FXSXX-COOH protein
MGMDDGGILPPDADGPAIPDVHRLPLRDLLDAGDSVLTGALRRLVHDLERPAENYAAHSTST